MMNNKKFNICKNYNKYINKRNFFAYSSYIKKEIIKEAYLSNNNQMERTISLMEELERIAPLKNINVEKSFNDFCEKHKILVRSYSRVRIK